MPGINARQAGQPRVSVVVPVYNPGDDIEPAIASILGQTLPRGQVEGVFVDDGSTDATPARLDRLAAEHPDTVRVIHIPPSGSPGRPRNVGIGAARGEYIQFLDADDELAPEALERVAAMADRNHSDIVVEKFASASIGRSQGLFHRNVEHSTLPGTPGLIDSSLGPAKLFRREFLLTHGIVFPEGWRLMEDQRFCLEAYLRADVISILADHACYYFRLRSDGGHLTSEPIDPARHFEALRQIFDFVEQATEPGPIRDRIVRRLLRLEVLARVGELTYLDLPAADRRSLFLAARSFVVDRIGPGDPPGLDPISRMRCALLREGREADLETMAQRMRDLAGTARLDRLRWHRGSLEVGVTAGLEFRSTGPLVGSSWSGKGPSPDPELAGEPLGVSIESADRLAGPRVDVVLRQRPTVLEWSFKAQPEPVPGPAHASSQEPPRRLALESVPLRVHARACVDLLRAAAGTTAIGPGTWDVLVRIAVHGVTRFAPLDVTHLAGARLACGPALLGEAPRIVVPLVDETGLHLEVAPPAAVVVVALSGRPAVVVRDGDRLVLQLAIAAGPSVGSMPANVVVRSAGGDRVIPAVLRASLGAVVLDARVAGLADLPAGPHPLAIRLGGPNASDDIVLGSARIEGPSRLRMEGLPRLNAADRAVAIVRWRLARASVATASLDDRARRKVRSIRRWLRRRVPR